MKQIMVLFALLCAAFTCEASLADEKANVSSQVTIRCNEQSKVSTNGSPVGFAVKKGDKFKLMSTEKICYGDAKYKVAHSRDRKTLTVEAAGQQMIFTSGKTTITITVK